MSVDVTTLQSLSSHEDPKTGIRERFLNLRVGGASTIGVLSEPLNSPLPMAWVLCHSFGLEQLYMQSIETPLARQMSAAGFPVLRFHAQGYGDSELPVEQVSLQSHIRDSIDAVKALIELTNVSGVGLMGARFGGAVAALVADRVDASALVLWHPIVSGRSFIDSLMRRSVLSGLASNTENRDVPQIEDPDKSLDARGFVDLQGFPVTRDAFEAFRDMDLVVDLKLFGGSSLIVQISTSEQIDPELGQLASRMRHLGGSCELEVVQHQRARGFGTPRFRPSGNHKVDTQAGLIEDLAERTVEWGETLAQVGSVTSDGEEG